MYKLDYYCSNILTDNKINITLYNYIKNSIIVTNMDYVTEFYTNNNTIEYSEI